MKQRNMSTIERFIFTCSMPTKDEYPALLQVWEASVLTTHLFLEKEDIQFFKNTIIEQNIFAQTNIVVARDEQRSIIGFIGVSGTSLDMIFIHPTWIGKGVGKMLMTYAIETQNINKVEVNEQNKEAVKFYKHFGFKVVGRLEHDGTGKPYPILYMER